jgi:VCBS repeat-containing protein
VDSDAGGGVLTVGQIDGVTDDAVDVDGTYGTLDWDFDGSYTYTLDNSSETVQGMARGEVSTDIFHYTLADENGGTDTAALTVSVTGENDVPKIEAPLPDRTDGEADSVNLDVSAAFSDPDDGETELLVFSASGLPAGLGLDSESGVISGTVDGGASSGGPNGDGVHDVSVTARDPDGAAVSDTFSWTVENLDPVATDNTAEVAEDADTTDSGNLVTDDDGFGVDSDAGGGVLTVGQIDGVTDDAADVDGTYGTLDWSFDGSYTYTLDNSMAEVQALNIGQFLTDTFVYTLSNENGGTDTATLTVRINGSFDPPLTTGVGPCGVVLANLEPVKALRDNRRGTTAMFSPIRTSRACFDHKILQ